MSCNSFFESFHFRAKKETKFQQSRLLRYLLFFFPMTNDNDNHNNDNKNYRVLKKWLGWREAQGWDEMCLDICRRTGEQPGCKRVCLQHRTGPPAASDALKDTTTQQGPWWLWNPLRNYSVAVSHEFRKRSITLLASMHYCSC